jgi:hypothetical protein
MRSLFTKTIVVAILYATSFFIKYYLIALRCGDTPDSTMNKEWCLEMLHRVFAFAYAGSPLIVFMSLGLHYLDVRQVVSQEDSKAARYLLGTILFMIGSWGYLMLIL